MSCMVIRLIGLSVVPAAHVGVLESAFVPSQLQIRKGIAFHLCMMESHVSVSSEGELILSCF